MYVSGYDILIYLYMEAQNYPPVLSRNTVAEITGAEEPEKVVSCYFAISLLCLISVEIELILKVVVVSGHLDSWDVGQGAMDGK